MLSANLILLDKNIFNYKIITHYPGAVDTTNSHAS